MIFSGPKRAATARAYRRITRIEMSAPRYQRGCRTPDRPGRLRLMQPFYRPARVRSQPSRPDDGAVAAAVVAPAVVEWRLVGDREAPRRLLVQVDAQAGPVADRVSALAQHRAAGEDVLLVLRELARLLDAEVGDGDIQVDV